MILFYMILWFYDLMMMMMMMMMMIMIMMMMMMIIMIIMIIMIMMIMIVNGIWRVFLLLLPKRVQMALRYLYIPLPSQPAALLASFSIRPSCISSLCTFRRYWFWSNFFGCCFRFRQLLLPKCMVDPQTLSNSVSIGSNNCRQGNKARNKLGNRLWVPTVALQSI